MFIFLLISCFSCTIQLKLCRTVPRTSSNLQRSCVTMESITRFLVWREVPEVDVLRRFHDHWGTEFWDSILSSALITLNHDAVQMNEIDDSSGSTLVANSSHPSLHPSIQLHDSIVVALSWECIWYNYSLHISKISHSLFVNLGCKLPPTL